jgi:hypothetical protein
MVAQVSQAGGRISEQQLIKVFSSVSPPLKVSLGILQADPDQGQHEILFGCEVVEESSGGNAGGSGDIAGSGLRETFIFE